MDSEEAGAGMQDAIFEWPFWMDEANDIAYIHTGSADFGDGTLLQVGKNNSSHCSGFDAPDPSEGIFIHGNVYVLCSCPTSR